MFVTIPILSLVIHFQNTTGSGIKCAFTLAFVSRLKIYRLSPPYPEAFKAMIFCSGFIMAESAVIGLLRGVDGLAVSIITTWFCAPVSLTQIYFSDSMVQFVKVINCGLTPTLVSCKYKKQALVSSLRLRNR